MISFLGQKSSKHGFTIKSLPLKMRRIYRNRNVLCCHRCIYIYNNLITIMFWFQLKMDTVTIR